ncbi:MAG: hypothetical protein WCF74_00310 [Candidatus Sulfotelmatobacter sp.]
MKFGNETMANVEGNRAGRGWPRWEWIFGALAIVSLVVSSRIGHRLPMMVQDVAFLILVAMPFLLTVMSWVGFALARRDQRVSRWRVWVSLVGCSALTVALAVPLLIVFLFMFRLSWIQWSIWCFASSFLALLAGIFGARTARFPLFFGGLVMGGLVVIVPIGIL